MHAATSTPAPRRRRRVKTPATSGKENAPSNTIRRRAVKPLLSMDDQFDFQGSSSGTARGSPEMSKTAQNETVRHFLQGSSDHASAKSLWKDHPDLAECVVKASLCSQSNSGLFFLEENSSKLLSTARKLIKDATESEEAKKYRWLMVATHILRATGPLLEHVEKQETCFRLLYHLITLSSDILSKGGEWKAGMVVVAGYEVLGKMLLRYSTTTLCGKTVYFEAVDGGSKERCCFVRPVSKQTRSQPGSMPFRQISTIAFKTTLAVATCFTQLWLRFLKNPMKGSDDGACTFGVDIHAILSPYIGKDASSYRATTKLLETTYMAWLLFSADVADEDCAKELSSHCKAAHRLLWDAASKLKTAGINLDNRTLETYSLDLRRCAVLMMVPNITEKNPMRQMLRDDHFETACAYAWKASSVFARQTRLSQIPVAANNPLYDFHARVGESLEVLRPSLSLPLVYVEYCAYRALHTASGPNLLSNGSESQDIDAESALLSILMLGIYFRQKLEGVPPDDSICSALALQFADVNMMDFVQQVAENFDQTVLSEFDNLAPGFRDRSFKILSLICLHRSIFAAVKEKSWQGKETDLLGGVLILSRCICPFSFEMARSCNDESKILTLFDTVVECSIRPLSAIETLRNDYLERGDMESADSLLGISDEVMERTCWMMCSGEVDGSLPSSCIEKVAKSLSIIGRQRNEKSMQQESLRPQLYSLKLYDNLSIHNSGADYNISSRYAQLATTLLSLDQDLEGCVALCLVLSSEASKCYQNGDDPNGSFHGGIDLLHFLAAKSKGSLFRAQEPFSATNLAKTAIRKLVHIISTSTRLENVISGFSPAAETLEGISALDLLTESLLDSDSNSLAVFQSIAQHLGSCLHYAAVGRADLSNQPGLQNKHLMLMIDVQSALGNLIAQDNIIGEQHNSNSATFLLREYQSFVEQMERTVDLFETAENPITTIALHVSKLIASSNLLPSRALCRAKKTVAAMIESQNGDFVRRLSLEYRQLLSSTNVSRDFINVHLALEFNGMNYHSMLDCITSKSDPLDIEINDLIDCAERSFTSMRDDACQIPELRLFATKTLVSSFAHLLKRLQREGDFSRVAKVSEWVYHLLADDLFNSDGGVSWFRAASISAHISGGLGCSNEDTELDLHFMDRHATSWSTSEYAEAELFVNHMRGKRFEDAASQKIDYPGDSLERLKTIISQRFEESKACPAWIPKWILSTIELAQAELASACGCFHLALRHLQQCIQICQEQLKGASSILFSSENTFFWAEIAAFCHPERVTQRLVDCLSYRSYLYQQVGDHRKMSPYLLWAGELLGIEFGEDGGKNLESNLSLYKATHSLVQRHFLRSFIALRSTASAFDRVEDAFSRVEPLPLVSQQETYINMENFTMTFGILRDMISVGDALYADCLPSNSHKLFLRYYRDALSLYGRLNEMDNLSEVNAKSLECLVPQIQLRRVRVLLTTTNVFDDSSSTCVSSLCDNVTMNAMCRPDDKAWAYYYLGLLMLMEARSSDSLCRLWEKKVESSIGGLDDVPEEPCKSIQQARNYFLEAATCIPLGTGVLSRNILRCLALVNGPEAGKLSALSCGVLILSSLGRSANESMLRSLNDQYDENVSRLASDLADLFSTFNGDLRNVEQKDFQIMHFFDILMQKIPTKWKFAAAALCPSGELLVTSIEKSESTGHVVMKTECSFPVEDHLMVYNGIIKPLDDIIQRSEKQLNGMDQAAVAKHFSKDAEKRTWWEMRAQQDDDLRSLVEQVECTYFRSLHMKTYIDDSGVSFRDSMFRDDGLESYPCGNLTSRFDAACNEAAEIVEEPDLDSYKKLTVVKLKERLRDHGMADKDMRKLRKQQLIDLLVNEETNKRDQKKHIDRPEDIQGSNACLFLLLDENLSRFPFEGMPTLQNRAVSRVPSLSFVLATLLERRGSNSDPSKIEASQIGYVLDPEGNLQGTRRRLEPVIDNVCFERNHRWDGCVGEIPTASFVENCLRSENGLFLYFGHGGGQTFFTRKQVEKLSKSNGSLGIRACRSSVILMGCSSGRLVSVNQSKSQSMEQLPLHFEPEGIALSYLCAGAPCVVGNLWDVTDHDIDRFSVACVEQFFGGEEEGVSLTEHVSRARNACKLRYIVGCAPVCYGIPVYLHN